MFSRRAGQGGPTGVLAMVPGRMGYRDLQTQRSGRRGLGRGRPAPGGPRPRHRAQRTENRPLGGRSCAAPQSADDVRGCPASPSPIPAFTTPSGASARCRSWAGRSRGSARSPSDPHGTDQRPRRGDRVRRGVRRQPAALRELRRQRAPDPRPHDPPGRHAARPPRAGPDRARGRDLPLPRALPRRRATFRAASCTSTPSPSPPTPPRPPSCAARTPTPPTWPGLLHDVGKLLMPAAFGVVALEEIAAEAPVGAAARRARAQAARARPRRRGRAAGRPVRARRRR